MSILFLCEAREVLNPSSHVAALLVGRVRVLEAFLETPSGLTGPSFDEVTIDRDQLRRFVERLLQAHNQSNHTLLRAMLCDADVAVLFALDVRCGLDAAGLPDPYRELCDEGLRLIGWKPPAVTGDV